jgi:hypothetical protein
MPGLLYFVGFLLPVWGRAPREPALSEAEGSNRAKLGGLKSIDVGIPVIQ